MKYASSFTLQKASELAPSTFLELAQVTFLSNDTARFPAIKLEEFTHLTSFLIQFRSNLDSLRVCFDDTLEVRIDTMYAPEAKFDIVNRRKMTF